MMLSFVVWPAEAQLFYFQQRAYKTRWRCTTHLRFKGMCLSESLLRNKLSKSPGLTSSSILISLWRANWASVSDQLANDMILSPTYR